MFYCFFLSYFYPGHKEVGKIWKWKSPWSRIVNRQLITDKNARKTHKNIPINFAARGNPAPVPQNSITHRLVLASWHRLEAYWSLMPIILIHALPPPLIACISKLHLTELSSTHLSSWLTTDIVFYSSHPGGKVTHWPEVKCYSSVITNVDIACCFCHSLTKQTSSARADQGVSTHILATRGAAPLPLVLDTPVQHTYTQYRLKE